MVKINKVIMDRNGVEMEITVEEIDGKTAAEQLLIAERILIK